MILVAVAVLIFVFVGSVVLQRCTPKDKETTALKNNNEFVGDQGCKSCHANEHNDWSQSHHFMAMQPANDSTVVGNSHN